MSDETEKGNPRRHTCCFVLVFQGEVAVVLRLVDQVLAVEQQAHIPLDRIHVGLLDQGSCSLGRHGMLMGRTVGQEFQRTSVTLQHSLKIYQNPNPAQERKNVSKLEKKSARNILKTCAREGGGGTENRRGAATDKSSLRYRRDLKRKSNVPN